jgi:transposase
MKSLLFVGIDVSKATLDVSVVSSSSATNIHYHQFANQCKGFAQLMRWIGHKSEGIPVGEWRVCMENTGTYSLELNCFLEEHGVWQCLENALQIKRSMGVVRGKTDKADSKIIALYAYRFYDQLKKYELPCKALLRLKVLFAQRERLVNVHKQIQLGLQSLQGYDKELTKDISEQNEALLVSLTAQIKDIDKSLKLCLKENASLHVKAQQMQSVPGIGLQTLVYMLIITKGMQAFDGARKFACYSGCAPFDHSSGTSVRGKSKVHFMANRKMKSLLHMAALNAVHYDEELKAYYQRKLSEGKNALSVLNAVRFKLISRVFSVVKRGETYQEEYYKLVA